MGYKKKKYIHKDFLGKELKVGDLVIIFYNNYLNLRRIKKQYRNRFDWILYKVDGYECTITTHSSNVLKVEETDEIKLYLKLGLYPDSKGSWEKTKTFFKMGLDK